ncbi:solute carrier family 35 member B1 homolog [Chironomus tepperi]|uniref:solute carrier family 35 member B1 homolog n=1 Tax=Chironomus tepperi TaxID=113505 RepID=UPI00391FC563
MLLRQQRIKLITLAVIILFCYSLTAIFQEKVLRQPYGEETLGKGNGEKFKFEFAFLAVQCIIFACVAKGVITVRKEKTNETPQRYFCIIAVFYVLAKVTSYRSLRYVPYPTSVVGKSAKPIPVMLLGVLIGRKTYTMYKYIFVTIVVIGVALFTFKTKYDKKDGEDPILGIIFIGVSLLMDGFLGAFEDRMRSVKKPTPLNLMFYLNSWNSLYAIAYLATTNEGVEFVQFCYRHPIVIRDLSVVVFFGIFGQFCITSMISYYGALPLSITTTIRKFVTVLLSVMIFNNVLTTRQWVAASIIFIALFLDGHFSRKGKKKSKEVIEEVTDGKEHIENGGEIIKRKMDSEKTGIDNIEKCEKISEQNQQQTNPNRRRKVRVSFEGDMLDILDEINYGFEDSDEDSTKNSVDASKEQKNEKTVKNQEIAKENDGKNKEEDGKECKATEDEKNSPTAPNEVENKLVPNDSEVSSQQSPTDSDQTINNIEKPKLYPDLEKEVSDIDSNSLKVSDQIVPDSNETVEHVNKENCPTENSTEIINDSSDDTKL